MECLLRADSVRDTVGIDMLHASGEQTTCASVPRLISAGTDVFKPSLLTAPLACGE